MCSRKQKNKMVERKMKITKSQLKQIIKEEIEESLGMDQEATGDVGDENQELQNLTAAVDNLEEKQKQDLLNLLADLNLFTALPNLFTVIDNLKQKHDYSHDEILEIIEGLAQ